MITPAVRRVRQHARRWPWFVKLDVRHYFETVRHTVLLDLLGRLVSDRRVLDLAGTIVRAGGNAPGRGLPIGNLTSQYFGNLLLGRLDHHLREVVRVPAMARYMDDVVLLGPDRETARALRDGAVTFVEGPLRLEVKHEATLLAPVAHGIPFLGFRIWPGLVRLDRARLRRFRARARALDRLPDETEAARRSESLFSWVAQGDTGALRRQVVACRALRDG